MDRRSDGAFAFCRRSARTIRTDLDGPGSAWMTRVHLTLLIRENVTQADDPELIRIGSTRLKTARISGSSRFPAVTLGGRRRLKASYRLPRSLARRVGLVPP